MEFEKYRGRRIRVWLSNNFTFGGRVVGVSGYFVCLIDEKTSREMMLRQDDISRVEVIE